MKTPSTARALLLAAATLTGAGCVTAVTVQIPHPLTRGLVQNNVPVADDERAAYFTLPPGTFLRTASLVQIDAQRVCFAVTLAADGNRTQLADMGGWRTFLRSDGFESMEPVFGPPAAQSVIPMRGTIPRQQFAGYYTSCTRYSYGTRCTQQPRYITVRDPAVINVVRGGGTVCFQHNGRINATTEQVTLHMDDPVTVTNRMAFRWRFLR